MGGIGSGAMRSRNVGNVEDTLSLDIRALRRLGLLRAGECVIDTVGWSNRSLGRAYGRLRADLSDIERGGTLTINANMPDGPITQHIAIEAVPSAFGGHRCYFVCPLTSKRCEILYYLHGGFASRKGYRLTYAVQGMTDLSRAHRKAVKLRSRLDGQGPFPRLRGRNRIDAVQKLRCAEADAKDLHLEQLRGQIGRSSSAR